MPKKTENKNKKEDSGTKPKPPATGRMEPPKNGVLVRMYRPGLGDCFLLAFAGADGKPFYMLIDCGVILGTENADSIMKDIVDDIAAATGGNIDVIAATHEHWDHVSGFVQAKSIFDQKIAVKNIWLAWTEDPANLLANQLRAERQHKQEALRAVVRRMHAAGAASAGTVEQLMGFFGDGLAAASGNSTAAALDNLRGFSKSQPRYCKPADPPIELKELPGASASMFWARLKTRSCSGGATRVKRTMKYTG